MAGLLRELPAGWAMVMMGLSVGHASWEALGGWRWTDRQNGCLEGGYLVGTQQEKTPRSS